MPIYQPGLSMANEQTRDWGPDPGIALSNQAVRICLISGPAACMLPLMITLATTHTTSREIKKSRFVATAAPVGSPEEACAFVTKHSDPKATHNTWAYRIGDEYRFEDDTEVSGTAGRPILSSIENHGLDHVVVLVTRYFGGIKLGAGGLVRAYGGTASICLDGAPKLEVLPTCAIHFLVPFELTGAVYNVLERFPIESREEQHDPAGLALVVVVQQSRARELRQALVNATRGAVVFTAPPVA